MSRNDRDELVAFPVVIFLLFAMAAVVSSTSAVPVILALPLAFSGVFALIVWLAHP